MDTAQVDIPETTPDTGPEADASGADGSDGGNASDGDATAAEVADAAVDPPECVTASDCKSRPASCKVATCGAGICLFAWAPDGAPCSSNEGCITMGTCKAKACVFADACCDDKIPCTKDIFYWLDSTCYHSVLPNCKAVCAGAGDCSDDDPCTTDACGATKACVFTAVAGCSP